MLVPRAFVILRSLSRGVQCTQKENVVPGKEASEAREGWRSVKNGCFYHVMCTDAINNKHLRTTNTKITKQQHTTDIRTPSSPFGTHDDVLLVTLGFLADAKAPSELLEMSK